MKLTRRDLVFSLALAVFFTIFYSSGRCPGNYWDDSGEVITAGRLLGVLHPPGHPLYPVLGRAIIVLTGLPPESAVTLLSTLFMALSVALLPLVIVSFFQGGGLVGSAAAAGIAFLTGFLPPLIVYGRIAELYGAVLFFFLIFLLAGAGAIGAGSDMARKRWMFIVLYLSALGAGVHMLLFVFTVPLVLLWLLFYRSGRAGNSGGSIRGGGRPAGNSETLPAACFWILGSSIFLYLPLRAASEPALCWGRPDELTGLLRHLLAFDFAAELQGFDYASGAAPFKAVSACLTILRGELGLAVFIAAAGAVVAVVRPSRSAITLLVALGTSLGAAAAIGGGMVLDAYMLPALVTSVILIYGFCFGLAGCFRYYDGNLLENRAGSLLFIASLSIVAGGSAVTRWEPEARAAATGWDTLDFSGEIRCVTYADLLLEYLVERRDMGPGSAETSIFVKTDNTVDYFALMEGLARCRIENIHVEYLPVAGIRFPAAPLFDEPGSAGEGGSDPKPAEIYFTPREQLVFPEELLTIAGPFFKLSGEAVAQDVDRSRSGAGSPDPHMPEPGTESGGIVEAGETGRDRALLNALDELLSGGNRHAVTRLSAIHGYRGAYFAATGKPIEALREYLIISEEIDTTNAGAFFNAGQICFNRLGDPENAIRYFRRAVALEPENRIFRTALARNLLKVETQRTIGNGTE